LSAQEVVHPRLREPEPLGGGLRSVQTSTVLRIAIMIRARAKVAVNRINTKKAGPTGPALLTLRGLLRLTTSPASRDQA
jgi:hypothetical protein